MAYRKEILGHIVPSQGVQEVWKYGIAFCGKKVWLERG